MRRLVTTLALSASLVVGTTAAAQAASLRIEDPADDVRTAFVDEQGEVSDVDAPNASPDVVATTVTHGRRAISIEVEFDDLSAPTDQQANALAFFVEGTKRSQTRQVIAVDTVEGAAGEVSRASGRVVCGQRRVQTSFDYESRVATATFPRSCASSPTKIRVAGGAFLIDDVLAEDTASFTYDDALAASESVDAFGSTRSAWVKRG